VIKNIEKIPATDKVIIAELAKDLLRTKEICDRYGCPLELIQKDISTVKYEPKRLWTWVKPAKEIALK